MKLAILNLSNNITTLKTVSSTETIMYKLALEKAGHHVDIISKKSGDYTISFEDVDDINNYDRLLVVNGAINFFGGLENTIITDNYKLMAKYKGVINYLFTDLRLPFQQLWPAIEHRGWGYSKEDVWVSSPIMIISQGRNLETTNHLHKIGNFKKGREFNHHSTVYFPLEQYKMVIEHYNPVDYEKLPQPSVDLIYGGSYRSGKRRRKMVKYLFDTEYSVETFGTMKLSQFEKNKEMYEFEEVPTFTKKVNATDVIKRMSDGLTTLIIGDDEYDNNVTTLRVWEAMRSNAIMLIDEDFDPEHRIMEDDFYYVKDANDVNDVIKKLKENEALRITKLSQQHKRYNMFDGETWLEELEEILC